MTATTVADREQRFASYLRGLVEREDRAALAALRRGLGKEPGEAAESHRYVVPFTDGLDPWREATFYLVGALFAWHQGSWVADDSGPGARNLGASLQRLHAQAEGSSVERRFVVLLNSHAEDLGEHLRHVVGLLRAGDAPIDWAQLLRDIRGWNRLDRGVQRAWARAFWGVQRGSDGGDAGGGTDGESPPGSAAPGGTEDESA